MAFLYSVTISGMGLRNGRNTGNSSPVPALSNRVFRMGTTVPEGDTRTRGRSAEGRRATRPRSRLRFRNLLASRDAAAPQMGGRKMTCRTIAVANQKGGTAKTATALGLGGVALDRTGSRVLLVDADPQGDLTKSLGWRDPDSLETTPRRGCSATARASTSYPPTSSSPPWRWRCSWRCPASG